MTKRKRKNGKHWST